MKTEAFVVENREKVNLRIENNLDLGYTEDSVAHDTFMDLMEDPKFIEYCQKSETTHLIEYLAEKKLIELKVINKETETITEISGTEVAIPAVAVLVFVEAVALIAVTIVAAVKEDDSLSEKYNLCTSEFSYCMKMIEKYGTEQLCRDMFTFFSSIESGETYTMKYSTPVN